MNDTVCAIVVTYNRKELLLECLEALRKQTKPLEAIYLVDNGSNDGTPLLLKENNYINKVPPGKLQNPWEGTFLIKNLINRNDLKMHYIRMHKNTGGAGGFHEGVKRAYKKGYDWLWLMDDDAEPELDALEKLESHYINSHNLAFANVVKDKDEKIQNKHRGHINFNLPFTTFVKPLNKKDFHKKTIEIDFTSFVGLLIKKEAIEKTGLPKKEFFIHNDDMEYCIRLRKVSKIIMIMSSTIYHKEVFMENINEHGHIAYENLWMMFYGKRNLIWIGKQNSTHKTLFYYTLIKNFFMNFISILFFDDNKFRRLIFLTECYKAGLNGNFDNGKPKRILKYNNIF